MNCNLKKKLLNLKYETYGKCLHFCKEVGKWFITIDINPSYNAVRKWGIYMSLFDDVTDKKDVNDLKSAYKILVKDLCSLGVFINDN